MASIPGVRFDISGASGSQGLLAPRESWRCFFLPRGGYASAASTGTLVTFDSAGIAARFSVSDWVQVGLDVTTIRQVGAVGGNSINLSGSAVTVSVNDRIFLFGTTEPSVVGGSATYAAPNTVIRQRDDDAATVYTNSMVTTNANGLVQAFSAPKLFDCIIQDGNHTNQGSIVDLMVGIAEGISVSDAAFFGDSVTVLGTLHSKRGPGSIRFADEFATGSSTGGIQEAITDLGGLGGEVWLSGVTYSCSAKITVPSNVTLRGAGMGKTIVRLANSTNQTILENTVTGGAGNVYVRLESITFDGNDANQTDNTLMLLNMQGVSQLEFISCEVRNCRASGLAVQTGAALKHVWVIDSYFHDTCKNLTANSNGALFINAITAQTGQIVVSCDCFETTGTASATATSFAAIHITGSNSTQIVVGQFTVKNSWRNGVAVLNGGRVIIHDFSVKSTGLSNTSNGGAGIYGSSNVHLVVCDGLVDGVSASSDNAVEIGGTSNSDSTVNNVTCTNVGNLLKAGISLANIGRWKVTNCTTSGNVGSGIAAIEASGMAKAEGTISGCQSIGNSRHGCDLRGVARVTIGTNDFSGNSNSGLEIGEGITVSGAEEADIPVTGLICCGNGDDGLTVAGEMVAPTGNVARRIPIVGGAFSGNVRNGIRLADIAGGCLLGAQIANNGSDGVRIQGSTFGDFVIDCCGIKGNSGYGVNVTGVTPTRLVIGQGNIFFGNTSGATTPYAGIPLLTGITPDVSGVITARIADSIWKDNFTNGFESQTIRLYGTTSPGAGVTNGGNFELGAASRTIGPKDMLTLTRINSLWVETSFIANS